MPETASSWLKDLTTLWAPSSTQFTGARSHKHSIETRLDLDMGIFRMFEIGSLRHETGVYHYSDADYLVSLKGERPIAPLTALNKVKASLQSRYTSTLITIRQPAVVCHFSDGIVEVVPAYDATHGGYFIPDPTGGWMLTYPENHNAWVTSVNAKHGGAAKKLARQVKIWKYNRNAPISSCYLEMRAAQHMDGEPSYVPLWDLHAALNKIYVSNLAAMNDPTGLGSRFTATSSSTTHADAISKLFTAVSRAQKAREFERLGDDAKAIEQLKLLFNV